MIDKCSVAPGLYPLEDSFRLLQPSFLRSLRVNASLVAGFASHLQSSFLDTMYMSYCLESQRVTCDAYTPHHVVCKVHCRFLFKCIILQSSMFACRCIFTVFHFVFQRQCGRQMLLWRLTSPNRQLQISLCFASLRVRPSKNLFRRPTYISCYL